MTKFQILMRSDDEPNWKEWTTEEGHSAKDAINKAYLAKPDGKIVAVVAVPMRSWKPQQIRTENVIRLRFGTDDDTPEAS